MRQVLWILLGLGLVVTAGCGQAPPPVGGGSVFSVAPRVTTPSRPAAPACSLLLRSDVLAVAQVFMNSSSTIVVADQGQPGTEQGVNSCFYLEKGYFTESDGSQSAELSGAGASLTYIRDALYDYSPRGQPPISGLGDGAYWDDGTNTVVVRKGSDVLQVSDVIPVNGLSDLKVPYQKASTLLAAKILAHL